MSYAVVLFPREEPGSHKGRFGTEVGGKSAQSADQRHARATRPDMRWSLAKNVGDEGAGWVADWLAGWVTGWMSG